MAKLDGEAVAAASLVRIGIGGWSDREWDDDLVPGQIRRYADRECRKVDGVAAGPGGAIAALRRLAREIFPSRQAAEQFARDEWEKYSRWKDRQD